MKPVFGEGIFILEGAEWAHSRAMLRPNFVRSQVADLEVFERHVGKLIARIPKNGETVDLSELFFMLTIDSGKLLQVDDMNGSMELRGDEVMIY